MTSWHSPQVGDIVTATKTIPLTFTDVLLEAGIRPRTRGVVLETSGSRSKVKFDLGHSFATTWVQRSQVRVVTRGVGEPLFTRRRSLVHLVRLGLLLALAAPFVLYAAAYINSMRSFDGLIESMALAALESSLELPGLIVQNPAQTLCFLAVSWFIGRFAVGR